MTHHGAPVLGYIVTSRDEIGAYELGYLDDTPPSGVLLIGDVATLFATRARAYAAIRRTRAYERRRGFHWCTWALRVQRLVGQRGKAGR